MRRIVYALEQDAEGLTYWAQTTDDGTVVPAPRGQWDIQIPQSSPVGTRVIVEFPEVAQ